VSNSGRARRHRHPTTTKSTGLGGGDEICAAVQPPYHHVVSSAKKFGGEPDEYQKLHEWLDGSKAHMADFRHRALRHHSEGIFMLEEMFGATMTISTGRVVPVRFIGEQHVLEDLGRIPTVQDWLGKIQPERWMLGRSRAEPR